MPFELLKPQVETIISDTTKTIDERLLLVCQLLETNIDYYNWVGFYLRIVIKKNCI